MAAPKTTDDVLEDLLGMTLDWSEPQTLRQRRIINLIRDGRELDNVLRILGRTTEQLLRGLRSPSQTSRMHFRSQESGECFKKKRTASVTPSTSNKKAKEGPQSTAKSTSTPSAASRPSVNFTFPPSFASSPTTPMEALNLINAFKLN